MTNNSRERLEFSIRSNIIQILGEQLITNEIVALTELLKNSYDADATKVEIQFIETPSASIKIIDNGLGMTLKDIINGWGIIGLSLKREKKYTSKYRRVLLGEKGIGRFAAQKLGNKLTIKTKSENSNIGYRVRIDWEVFTNYQNLNKVNFPIEQLKSEDFPNAHGTEIIIEDLFYKWTEKRIERLNEQIQITQYPFSKQKNKFDIIIISEKFPHIQSNLQDIFQLLPRVPYLIEGTIDSKNEILNAKFEFRKPESNNIITKEIKKEIKISKEFDLGLLSSYNCGKFKFQIWCWERDNVILKRYSISSTERTKILEKHAGLRIYRDEFRIFPYGNPGNDWLELDKRRVRRLGNYISNKQILGYCLLTKHDNPNLVDKTDREGLIENYEYEIFERIVYGIISLLESERLIYLHKYLREEIEDTKYIKKKLSIFSETLEVIKSNKFVPKSQIKIIESEYRKLQESIDSYYDNILDPIYTQAGLAAIYKIPFHEIYDHLLLIKNLITNIKITKTDTIKIQKQIFNELKDEILLIMNIVNTANTIIKGISSKKKGNTSIRYILDYLLKKLLKTRIDSTNTAIIDNAKDYIINNASNEEIVSLFRNILDNSLYWSQENANPTIKIFTVEKDNGIIVIFTDNGPGFIDEQEILLQPFFSRKPNGIGLGLYIIDTIMTKLGGHIIFDLDEYNELLLEGASIGLYFKLSD